MSVTLVCVAFGEYAEMVCSVSQVNVWCSERVLRECRVCAVSSEYVKGVCLVCGGS